MTVVPFVRRDARPRPGVRIAVRRDLVTGLAAAGAVRGDVVTIDRLVAARAQWRDAGQTAPLAFAPNPAAYADAASAGNLGALLAAAGFAPRELDVEVDEQTLAGGSLAGVERLRARGFGVALAADAACPLPLGGRARALFTEILIPAPSRLDPFLGADAGDARPLARRLFAARAQGVVVTACGVGDMAWACALAAAGFQRGEGPWADEF
jgi:hypothetical protein